MKVDGGLTFRALAGVEQFQPYQRADAEAHPLHVLNTLWNIDKHRHLHLTALQATNTQVFLGPADGSALVGGQFQTRVVGDGDIIAAFRFQGGEIDPDLELMASGANFLALGDAGPWAAGQPVQSLLEQLHAYVTLDVLPRLEPLLAAAPDHP